MAHRRFEHPESCMAVRAGARVWVGGGNGATGPGDPVAQAEQALRDLEAALKEAGGALAHIRRVTTYITDRAWQESVDSVLRRRLGDPGPARLLVIVAGLSRPETLVQIDADAVIPA